MSFFERSYSAIAKLAALAVLLAVFVAGMVGVVFMSLQGAEVKVPDMTGKNFGESEHELASLGLKLKKRADRVSQDPPNTIIEQLPKPGETVKTGQMILVVTSKSAGEGEQIPAVKKPEEDDTSKIEEMISDKPKKPKANSNSNKKKADTTRDLLTDNTNSDSNSNSDTSDTNSNKKGAGANSNAAGNSNKKEPQSEKRPAANTARPVDGRPRASNRPN